MNIQELYKNLKPVCDNLVERLTSKLIAGLYSDAPLGTLWQALLLLRIVIANGSLAPSLAKHLDRVKLNVRRYTATLPPLEWLLQDTTALSSELLEPMDK